ncbi:MAG: hypothetical protein WKF79_13230 [Nocardioides sp.]
MNNVKGTTWRSGAVWLAVTTGTALMVAMAASDLRAAAIAMEAGSLTDQPFDRLVIWLCSAVLTISLGWGWLVTSLVVGEVIAEGTCGTRRRARGVPGWVRHAVLAACGVAVLGAAAPATATPGEIHLDRAGREGSATVRGLPLPDRAVGGAHRRPPAASAEVTVDPRHLVRPGESLWSIAATAAGAAPGAAPGNSEVAAYWREIYVANRHVIGPDPDLIQPGQLFRLPPR